MGGWDGLVKDDEETRGHAGLEGEVDPQAMAGEAYPLLKQAVVSILKGSDEARSAYEALLSRGLSEEDAREEIARVLLATMFHVGAQSEMLESAGLELAGTIPENQTVYEFDLEGRATIELPDDNDAVQSAFDIFQKVIS